MVAQTVEKEEIIELASEGYLYRGTAPRWRKGKAYFYLVKPENGHTMGVAIECSEREFKEVRKMVENKMGVLWGKKYYTAKKERERAKKGEYIYKAVENLRAQYIESCQ